MSNVATQFICSFVKAMWGKGAEISVYFRNRPWSTNLIQAVQKQSAQDTLVINSAFNNFICPVTCFVYGLGNV